MRILVVDDEPLARDELVFLLGECPGTVVVGQASHASEALSAMKKLQVDTAFVDLRMPGPDGIALAESIRQRFPACAVVLVSAHDDGAVRAFEAQVFDYLLKPVRLERLQQTLGRLRDTRASDPSDPPVKRTSRPSPGEPLPTEKASQALDRIAVRRRGAYVVIDIADVLYFEVRDELVWAVTREDRFAFDMTLSAVESQVPPGDFFRCHRGFLVRVASITAIEPVGGGIYTLRVQHADNPAIPLARERARQLRELIPFTG